MSKIKIYEGKAKAARPEQRGKYVFRRRRHPGGGHHGDENHRPVLQISQIGRAHV